MFNEIDGDFDEVAIKTFKKAVYIPSIQVEAVFEGEATSSAIEMIIKPCNERLMT